MWSGAVKITFSSSLPSSKQTTLWIFQHSDCRTLINSSKDLSSSSLFFWLCKQTSFIWGLCFLKQESLFTSNRILDRPWISILFIFRKRKTYLYSPENSSSMPVFGSRSSLNGRASECNLVFSLFDTGCDKARLLFQKINSINIFCKSTPCSMSVMGKKRAELKWTRA